MKYVCKCKREKNAEEQEIWIKSIVEVNIGLS